MNNAISNNMTKYSNDGSEVTHVDSPFSNKTINNVNIINTINVSNMGSNYAINDINKIYDWKCKGKCYFNNLCKQNNIYKCRLESERRYYFVLNLPRISYNVELQTMKSHLRIVYWILPK